MCDVYTYSIIIVLIAMSWPPSTAAVYVYYYEPGQTVNRRGGGKIIPVPDGG